MLSCPVSGCTAMLNPGRIERHLRKVNDRGINSKFAEPQLNIRSAPASKSRAAAYVVVKPVSEAYPRESAFGQAPEKIWTRRKATRTHTVRTDDLDRIRLMMVSIAIQDLTNEVRD